MNVRVQYNQSLGPDVKLNSLRCLVAYNIGYSSESLPAAAQDDFRERATMTTPANSDGVRLKLFVIYHQKLHPPMYAGLGDANLAKLTFYKVNEAIPFEIGLARGYVDVVKEYELPAYDPFYQAHAFNEGSCMIHVYRNRLFENSDYMGMVNYDMPITDAHFSYWQNLMRGGAEIIAVLGAGVVRPELYAQDYIREAPFLGFPMAFAVERLCSHLGVDRAHFTEAMTRRYAEGRHLPLLNSFIVRSDIFVELSAWIAEIAKDLYDYTMSRPAHVRHHGHMSGLIERCVGLFLLFRCGDGKAIHSLGLKHIHVPELHRYRHGQM